MDERTDITSSFNFDELRFDGKAKDSSAAVDIFVEWMGLLGNVKVFRRPTNGRLGY